MTVKKKMKHSVELISFLCDCIEQNKVETKLEPKAQQNINLKRV